MNKYIIADGVGAAPLGAVCPCTDSPLTQTLHLQHCSALLSHLDVCRVTARHTASSIALNGLFFPPSPPVKRWAAAGAVRPARCPRHPNTSICAPCPPFSPSQTLLVALISFHAHNRFSDPVLLPQYPVFLTPITVTLTQASVRLACGPESTGGLACGPENTGGPPRRLHHRPQASSISHQSDNFVIYTQNGN